MHHYMPRDRTRRSDQLQAADESSKRTTATKLFTYLLCHGEECRLDLFAAKKRLDKFTGRNMTEEEALAFIKSFPKKFEVKKVDGRRFVEAKTSVKLCDAFQAGKCNIPSQCKLLHICRFFLQDDCKFGEKCQKPHSFDSSETAELLRRHQLNNLSLAALTSLFKKVLKEKIVQHTSETTGPKPCAFYNKGVCKNGDKCRFLHVCEHFIEGDCKFFGKCKKFHNFDTSHSRKVLEAHSLGGLRNESQILSVLRSSLECVGLSSGSEDDDVMDVSSSLKPVSSGRRSRLLSGSSTSETDAEKLEICGFNLRGKCQYGGKCNARHTSLPYEWQYLFGRSDEWKSFSLEENRKIEKEFCNVEKSREKVSLLTEAFMCSINFQTLTGKIHDTGTEVKIRRLSTVSSVLAASGHVFRTKWKWYWLDEHGKWQSYDDEKTTTNSEKIELDYKSEDSGKIEHKFSCGLYQYTLHFDNPNQLYQQNDRLGTKREVRRRPAQFLDEWDMKAILEEFKRNHQRTSSSSSNSSESQYSVPTHWSPVDPSEEFKVADLSEVLHHEEFTRVKRLFSATMAGYRIKSVKRVQNAGLWQDYERQKSKIEKNNSGNPPEERWLFHGTNQDTVDPICQQGFDWRLSGKHGTRYGKGSYFAVEASYSKAYSKNSAAGDNHRMFMARVIVGSYVLGDYDTQRPPSKDKTNPLSVLHDSCVNDVNKPTIFVVFERSQAYPYYIIDYGI